MLAERIAHDFQGYNVSVKLTDEMRQHKFHPEYRISHIMEANKLLDGTQGISASKDFLDLLDELLESQGDVVVWRYEMTPQDKLSICNFITKRYGLSDNVKLLPDLEKVGSRWYMLPGNDFILLYESDGSLVSALHKVPKDIFVHYKKLVSELQFTVMTVPPTRINSDVLERYIWKEHVSDGTPLQTMCNRYIGDTYITQLYCSDTQAVYCYKENNSGSESVRFEVIDYAEDNNANSCTLPWDVYTAICDKLNGT